MKDLELNEKIYLASRRCGKTISIESVLWLQEQLYKKNHPIKYFFLRVKKELIKMFTKHKEKE